MRQGCHKFVQHTALLVKVRLMVVGALITLLLVHCIGVPSAQERQESEHQQSCPEMQLDATWCLRWIFSGTEHFLICSNWALPTKLAWKQLHMKAKLGNQKHGRG